MTAITKTIPFDRIKARAIEIAAARTDKTTSLNHVAGSDRFIAFDIELAYETLLPAMLQAGAEGVSAQQRHVELSAALAKAVETRIANWDVREVNRLVDLFPNSVPPACRLRCATAAYDDDGNWAVTFDLGRPRERSVAPTMPETRAVAMVASTSPWRLRALLPEVKAAQEAFDAAFAKITGNLTAIDAEKQLKAAIAEFNKVLARAAAAFYLDTADYNHWATIRQVYAPDRKGEPRTTLWFSEPHEQSKTYANLEKLASDLERGADLPSLAAGDDDQVALESALNDRQRG